jgi:GT2 family glycosyltransferase
MNKKHSITFGIATLNRKSDLIETVDFLVGAGFADYPFIIVDDGSTVPIDLGLLKSLNNVMLVRHDYPQGYIASRNEIVSLVETKYYFSLDDDSYLAEGDISKLLIFLDSLSNWIAVGFEIRASSEAETVRGVNSSAYKCRTYVGCAHVINVDVFRGVGGYDESLIRQGEEMELSARAYLQGFDTWHYPYLVVFHRVTPVCRNYCRVAYYTARNKVRFIVKFYSGVIMYKRIMFAILGLIRLSLFRPSNGHFRGFCAGLVFAIKFPGFVNSNVGRYMRDWVRLPLY